MIHLLFTVVFSEMAMIILMSFKTPLRKLIIMGLDRVKRGRGPIVVKTVAATVVFLLASSVYSMVKIQNRWIEDAASNPTDQILMAKHLLEATLMDRLHHYIRELRIRRKTMEAVKKQNQGFEDAKASGFDEIKAKEEEMATLREKLKQLESDIETKNKDVHAAEANAVALRKQSEGFLLEYDRLLEENQNLRNRLRALDQSLSRSGSKKNT
uniref:Endoplasmic reticulum transmembrane protein n=1 Tax=Cannabis sativa TaxID=3483 RepID=A0A803NZJ9_CANSA